MWRLHPGGEYHSRICYEPNRCAAYFRSWVQLCVESLPFGSEPAFKTSPTDKECVKGAWYDAMLRYRLVYS